MDEPVLLPPPRARERPLPRWVVPLALVGLAVTSLSLVPAALEHRRLAGYRSRLAEETRSLEHTVTRLQKRLNDAGSDTFLRDRELQNLLNPR